MQIFRLFFVEIVVFSDEPHPVTGSKLKLVFLPLILITGYLVMVGQAAIGFADVSLALYLKEVPDFLFCYNITVLCILDRCSTYIHVVICIHSLKLLH